LNLKTKRKQMRMTQKEMGSLLGITQVSYGNYELGKRQPKPETLKKMARIFGCTVDELLEDSSDKNDNGRVRKKAVKTA